MASHTLDIDQSALHWLRAWTEDGEVRLRIGRAGDELVAEWAGDGVLRATRDGKRAAFTDETGASYDVGRDVAASSPINAYLRHLRGELTLHASCVELASNARATASGTGIAFAGVSGVGKSTLAAALCQSGLASLIADDTLVLDQLEHGFVVQPSATWHSLRADSASALGFVSDAGPKTTVAAARNGTKACPLRAIVSLVVADHAKPSLEPLRGAAAFSAVSRQVFRFVLDEPTVNLDDFAKISSLIRAVPVFQLARTSSLSDLDDAAKLVLQQFSGG